MGMRFEPARAPGHARAVEGLMARWYEGAEESAFKPTAGGYVFQQPSPTWPFGRPVAYLVDEAQKAALIGCLRRQRLQILLV